MFADGAWGCWLIRGRTGSLFLWKIVGGNEAGNVC